MKTEKITYSGYHRRLYRKRGRPSKCEHCGTTTAKKFEWANKNGDYTKLENFIRLCVRCHIEFDNRAIWLKQKNLPKKICLLCKKFYKPRSFVQKYCGDKKLKIGCIRIRHLESAYKSHEKRKTKNRITRI